MGKEQKEQNEERIMILKMLYTFQNNVKDDVCGHPEEKAKRLIKAGHALKATKADVEEWDRNNTVPPKKKKIIVVEPE